MTGHVALYLRISSDQNGRADGVTIQERQGRAYAAQQWPGLRVETFTDNDLSAASDEVFRPSLDRLLAAVQSGLISQLWTASQSRLARREAGTQNWFDVAAVLAANGITSVHTRDDGIVHPGDVVSGIKAVLAAEEVRQLKRRIHARLDANAAAGQPSGVKPFGYVHAMGQTPDGRLVKTYAVVPEQAAAVRIAAERLLAGWSLASIAQALSAQGVVSQFRRRIKDSAGQYVTGPDGRPVTRECQLSAVSVRSWLTHAAVAGLRTHQGTVIGRGNWEGILTESEWRDVNARLSGPRVVTRPDGTSQTVTGKRARSGSQYLLTSGVAVCGVCGAPMSAQLVQRRTRTGERRPSVATYLCHPRSGGKACTAIRAEALETYVIDQLFAQLDRPEFAAAVAADDSAARRDEITTKLAALEAQELEAADMFLRRDITGPQMALITAGLADRKRELAGQLAAIPAAPVAASAAEIRDSWQDLNLAERRELIRTYVAEVKISRVAKRGANAFDSGRVAITYCW